MLWLALRLPLLPVEVIERGRADEAPLALVERQFVLIPNRAARQGGIRPGMRVSAAQALLPELQLTSRRPREEHDALQRLAGWALQYTGWVSPEPPEGLLLEVGGSLRLFEGLDPLLRRLTRDLKRLGYRAVVAVAPTPTGAWLLARAGDERPVTDTTKLRSRLAALPLQALPLDKNRLLGLESLGLGNVGDCMTLPSAGLARRLGRDLPHLLERALGRRPDLRSAWQPPPAFRADYELTAEVDKTEPLLFILQRLLQELCGFLRGLDAGIQEYVLRFFHASAPTTRLRVGLVRPSRDPEHLFNLGRERLERLALAAPVRSLDLNALHIRALAPERPSLLDTKSTGRGEPWQFLVERLHARLGEAAVVGLRTLPDHRPERAWSYTAPGQGRGDGHRQRPLWLFSKPRPLRQIDGVPHWHGPLILQKGPERIESGWWDDCRVRRDYYVASNSRGEQLWIFRERRPPRRWFLHGLFG